jgi:hypothetical protein
VSETDNIIQATLEALDQSRPHGLSDTQIAAAIVIVTDNMRRIRELRLTLLHRGDIRRGVVKEKRSPGQGPVQIWHITEQGVERLAGYRRGQAA